MPTLREYRVVLPLSLEEFERGRRWHKTEQIKLELKLLQDDNVKVTEFGERTLLREETPDIPTFYSESSIKEGKTAAHTIKGYGGTSGPAHYPFLSSITSMFDIFVTNSVKLTQVESWEAYPYFRSVSSNTSLGPRYNMTIEGICIPGRAKEENPLQLSQSMLKERQVILVDIASNVGADDYRDGKDPILFRSEKTGRGPLEPGVWMEDAQPCLTCYILVSVHFDCLGPLGPLVERKLHNGIHRTIKLHHRELFCYIDEWIDFSSDELLQTLKKLEVELDETVAAKLRTLSAPSPPIEETKKPDVECVDGATEHEVMPGCCPIDAVKVKILSCCSEAWSGQNVSFVALGLGTCLLALVLAFIVQSTYF